MTNLFETDAGLAELINLKQAWLNSGCPKQEASDLKRKIDSFPVKLEIHDLFLKNLKKEMETERECSLCGKIHKPVSLQFEQIEKDKIIEPPKNFCQALPSETAQILKSSLSTKVVTDERVTLPVRNHGNDIPGHIKVFKEHNGLIHGGIVYKKNYTLVCKAYRYFVYQNTNFIDVVAGVCEQKNKEGKVINQWSTAPRLQPNYANNSLPFLDIAMLYNNYAGIITMQGFYIPSDWAQHVISKNGHCPDNGLPLPGIYNPIIPAASFAKPPGYKIAIENALFNLLPTGGPGTPICTPYIKITAPHPDMKETIVQMVGVYREQFGGGLFNWGGEHYFKTFT